MIIGGGFAGLAAAVELVSRGHHVTLIERKGHLGGRAYSFQDAATGSVLDNGQHVLMGCYRDTLEFLKKIGTEDCVFFQRNLAVDFASGEGKLKKLRAWPLPSPLHLLGGLFFFGGLSWSDKLSLLRLQKRHICEGDNTLDRKSVSSWLAERHQSERIRKRFWEPLSLAALNDRPEESSAALFAAVLREALFAGRKASRIGIPRVGLSDLYTEAARDYVERKGGHFLLKSPVLRLHFRGGEFQEAELEGGRRISAEVLLVTVPFTALRKILPEELLYEDSYFKGLSHLQTSPIVSIHLWFDREITKSPFVGFWGEPVDWMFNKGHYLKDDHPPYVSLVTSGARRSLQVQGPQLVEQAIGVLTRTFPEVGRARLIRSVVTKEPEATMAPAPGASRYRLSQKTPYRNLFLAGDWTDTGLPATIESAVRSANKAVEFIEQAG